MESKKKKKPNYNPPQKRENVNFHEKKNTSLNYLSEDSQRGEVIDDKLTLFRSFYRIDEFNWLLHQQNNLQRRRLAKIINSRFP